MSKKLKILLLFNEIYKQESVISELSKTDYELDYEYANSFIEFQDLLKKFNPDIVLSDYLFDDLNASEYITKIKNLDKDIPLIIISNPIGDENVAKVMRNGASDFILFDNLHKLKLSIRREIDEIEFRKNKWAEIDDIKLLNYELEARVFERTALLEEANSNLLKEIEEKREIELQLLETQMFFNIVIDYIPFVISVRDAKTLKYTFINKAFVQFTGKSKLAVIDKTPEQIFNQQLAEYITQRDLEQLKNKTDFTSNVDTLFVNNKNSILNIIKLLIKDSKGEPEFILNIIEDITQKKQKELEIEKISMKFSKLFHFSSNAILVIDRKDLTIIDINNSFLEMLGYKIEELLLKKIDETDIWQNIEEFKNLFDMLKAKRSVKNIEATLKTKNSENVIALISIDNLLTDGENLLIFQAIDITERKNYANEILRALEKEKDLNILKNRFISMISHEFRTPLTTIMLSTDLLKRYSDHWDVTEKNKHYDRIQTTILRMTQLMENVLTIGRLEAGKFDFQPESIDLQAFSKSIAENIEFNFSSKNTINFKFIGNCIDSKIDENLMALVLTNLLTNACKYSPNFTPVDFTVVCNESRAIFKIKDYGVGIPKSEQDKLFNTFFRASNVGNINGYGLGLSIVQRCVEAHLGTIRFETTENEGTCFIVEVPINIDTVE